jgi:parvulin-like peptidyl-prolyl isomerase
MVNDVLIRQEAKKRGITVTSQEVDKAVQEAFGYFANGTPTPTPTEKLVPTSTLNPTQLALVPPTSTPTATPSITATGTLSAAESPTPGAAQAGTQSATQAALETATQAPNTTTTPTAVPSATPTEAPTATPTPYTLQGFQDTYKKTVSDLNKSLGFTDKDLRYMVETQLYQEKLMKAIIAEEKVTPQQDEVWARHILVADEKTAQQVLDRLNKGEAWDKVAAEMSTDTSNKDNGGDLGWFYKGRMDPAFEQAAWQLKIGQISQPVKTTFGYHIIQVLGHETRTLSESDFQQLEQTRFQTWLQGVHDKAKIDIKSDWVDKAPAEPTLPADITNYLQQQQNAQPQSPNLNLPTEAPTEAPGAAATPEPSTTQAPPASTP